MSVQDTVPAVRGDQAPRVCIADFERAAAATLPRDIWDFIAGGSGDEHTLRSNRAALDAVAVTPRVLTGVRASSTAATLVESIATLPLAVAPMAYQRLAHDEGESALARAARAAGVPYMVSSISSTPLEDIAQLYWLRDCALVLDLVGRAERAGCRALMVTVDVPIMGRRLRDVRNGFALPPGASARNLSSDTDTAAHRRQENTSGVAAHTQAVFDPALSWGDLRWLAGQTHLPLVLKGVLEPADAEKALAIGTAAVVVSNHGGRQLNGAPPSISALPGAVAAVAGRCQVLLDSGVRSGTDILRALACGADGVLVGRPLLWGLAARGNRGHAKCWNCSAVN